MLYELNQAGYESYLVGGCIRDLLIGSQPKDFDVATNATPEQVRQVFRRSRIVGRRFKIVHVRMGREVIEVTTFRGPHAASNQLRTGQADEHGMLLRDNVYGDMRGDALRRDFSINALYYTVDGFRLVDYVGALDDIARRTLRILGDPATRYREDPVRMLRAARFVAKLNFQLEESAVQALAQNRALLSKIAPARLFDEINKLFLSGYGQKSLEATTELGLLPVVLGNAADELSDRNSGHYKLMEAALKNSDERLRQGKSATPAFLFACILWRSFVQHYNTMTEQGYDKHRATQYASHTALETMHERISIPRRFAITIKDIWQLQSTLESAKGNRAIRLLGHSRFRAAYDFLLMREQAGELEGYGDFWTQLQKEHPEKVAQTRSRFSEPRPRNYKKRQAAQ